MRIQSFNLRDFVTESNRIEGIRGASKEEIDAHETLLDAEKLTIACLKDFVAAVQPGAVLRDKLGFNVRVGNHRPPPGGPSMPRKLEALLEDANGGLVSPWHVHVHYETLHPFMDGNGRSGRAVWLWMMGGMERAPLGFLHHFYYQTLQNTRL